MGENKTSLNFVTEIGTFGSMPIKDPTVQEVTELKDLAETTDNPDLKKFLQNQLNKK